MEDTPPLEERRGVETLVSPARDPHPEPEVDEDTPSLPGGISLAELRKRWPEVIDFLRQTDKKPVAAQLEHAELKSLEEDRLTIMIGALPLVEALTKNEKILVDAIRRVAKVKLKIKVIHAQTADASAPSPTLSPSLTDFMQGKSIKSVRPDTNNN